MNRSFLTQNSNTLNEYLRLIKELAYNEVTHLIKEYNEEIKTLQGSFLSLAVKAFGFNVIENFLANGKKFFKALPQITTFEGFLDLVESIFLSREITIEYINPAVISITVVNKNQELLKNYIDKQGKEYVDKIPLIYKGFKVQDFLGLEAFFKKFLQPFLPAGVVLSKITLINPNKPTTLIKKKRKK